MCETEMLQQRLSGRCGRQHCGMSAETSAAAVLEMSQKLERHGYQGFWGLYDSIDDGPQRWKIWCSAALAPDFLSILSVMGMFNLSY